MVDSIFTKIINREIPSTIVYEDDEFISFKDINPHAPVHVLVVPKKPYETLEKVSLEDSNFHAKLLQTVRKIAQQLGIANNYKIAMNVGDGVQQVMHVHVHLMGGWEKPSKE
jgi:histidine triad (HIT) family protein